MSIDDEIRTTYSALEQKHIVSKKKRINIKYVDAFLNMLSSERSASANTILSYTRDLTHMLEFFHGLDKIGSVVSANDKLLSQYLQLLNGIGLKRTSISRKISTMRQFFTFLFLEGVRSDNPAINIALPKKAKSVPRAIAESHIDTMLKYASEDKSYEGIRNTVMLEILYATGMRISELVTMKMCVLERDQVSGNINKKMLIIGKGKKERVALLNDIAIDKLELYLSMRVIFIKMNNKRDDVSYVDSNDNYDGSDNTKSSIDWLFPSLDKCGKISHITRQRFGQILKEMAVMCNIDPDIVSPHKIRHSFATHMLNRGADLRLLQELLGHADISSTQIYTKTSGKRLDDLLLKKHPLATAHNKKKKNN